MFDSITQDIISNLKRWASCMAPLIRGKYKRSFANNSALDILQTREPAYCERGSWQGWIPGSSGLSLSLAVNIDQAAWIIRDHKGTFKFACIVQVIEDDIFKAIVDILDILDEKQLKASYLFCSHKDMLFLHT
ncbi:hypothetical protein QQ045_010197 [Rhodiola kirilowii]